MLSPQFIDEDAKAQSGKKVAKVIRSWQGWDLNRSMTVKRQFDQ